jgi:surface antigen
MANRHNNGLALALGAFAVLAMAPSHAGNLDFLSKSPVSYFNDEDIRLLKAAVTEVLDDSNVRATKNWSNPATGNSGKVEGRSAFKTAEGVECRRVRVTNHAKAVDGQGTYTVCKVPGEDWVVDQAAKPAS